MDDGAKLAAKQSKQLYWCARCKSLLTKEQAEKISCLEPPQLNDQGQPNCALGTDIFTFYKDRTNPLLISPGAILHQMMLKEQKE